MPGQRGYGEPLRREVACSRLRARTRRPSWLYDRWVEPPFVHYYRRVLHARAPATTASVAAVAEVVEAEALESACGCRLFRHLMRPACTHGSAHRVDLVARPSQPTGRQLTRQPRHRHSEFLDFLKLVAKVYPRRQLHVVVDNYATHKHQRVQAWLASHPRVHLHFTPTYASWLNLVEVFFRSSSAKRCAAATSPASTSWSQRSAGSAMAGTNAASRSAGPRTPTRSSPHATAGTPQQRATSSPHTGGRQGGGCAVAHTQAE